MSASFIHRQKCSTRINSDHACMSWDYMVRGWGGKSKESIPNAFGDSSEYQAHIRLK